MQNPTLLSTKWEFVNQVGKVKYIPLSELRSEHAKKMLLNKSYFYNNPPTTELDREDPDQDMTRVYHPLAKQVIKKGALFLFGQQKFRGLDSFKFENKEFEKEFARVWRTNKMGSKLQDLGQRYFRDGDIFYKVVSKKIGTEIVGETIVEGKPVVEEKEIADIRFLRTEAEHWTPVVLQDDPTTTIIWVYQFERDDGSYVREEYFMDKMVRYTGKLVATPKLLSAIKKMFDTTNGKAIPTEGFIEYTCTEIQEYPEFGRFPIWHIRNNEESALWAPTVLDGHYGEFDHLNMVLTRIAYAIKMQADPLLWVAGAESADQNTHTADAVWSFTDANASLNVLQWQGTPDSVFNFINMIESKIYDCAFVPRNSEIEKIFSSDNRMSGKGLQELRSDIIEATLNRRGDFEQGFEDMLDIIARLTGLKVPANESGVDIIWGPVFATGAAEKRESLVTTYFKNGIINRERVIEMSDDFTPQMKDELIKDLAKIDQEQADKLKQELQAKASVAAAIKPASSGPANGRPRKR